jgi:uncharacterized membrane protein
MPPRVAGATRRDGNATRRDGHSQAVGSAGAGWVGGRHSLRVWAKSQSVFYCALLVCDTATRVVLSALLEESVIFSQPNDGRKPLTSS